MKHLLSLSSCLDACLQTISVGAQHMLQLVLAFADVTAVCNMPADATWHAGTLFYA